MCLVGLADSIWSEAVLVGEKNTQRKGSDAVNVGNFGGTVGESSKNFCYFGLKGVAVVDSD